VYEVLKILQKSPVDAVYEDRKIGARTMSLRSHSGVTGMTPLLAGFGDIAVTLLSGTGSS
jgi:hypothetical protein